MTTLRQVASLAEVSAATVSRVFSRPEAVNENTRRRVLEAARQLDFVPNPVARSLARGRTGNLGLLVPDIKNPAMASVIVAVQEHAQQNGHVVFVAAGNGRAEDELSLVQAIARQVDGMVLIAPRMSDDDLATVTKLAPAVLVNRLWPDAPSVILPGGDGMAEAVDHLADLGHQSSITRGAQRRTSLTGTDSTLSSPPVRAPVSTAAWWGSSSPTSHGQVRRSLKTSSRTGPARSSRSTTRSHSES